MSKLRNNVNIIAKIGYNAIVQVSLLRPLVKMPKIL